MRILVGTENVKKWLEANLIKYKVTPDRYVESQFSGDGFLIKVYNNGTLVMSGGYEDRIYDKLLEISGEQGFVGCDEVGVGDFFGPVVYCAVQFTEKTLKALQIYRPDIKDSKKLKDEQILDIYGSICDQVDFSSQIVYDSQIENMNNVEQKVFYHHQNVEELKDVDEVVIDLFTTEKSFWKYSKGLGYDWPEKMILETRADSKYMCVALASIFARAIFVSEMNKLNQKYEMVFPYGAGNVKEIGRDFLDKYSKEELATFAKTSFKTFDEL